MDFNDWKKGSELVTAMKNVSNEIKILEEVTEVQVVSHNRQTHQLKDIKKCIHDPELAGGFDLIVEGFTTDLIALFMRYNSKMEQEFAEIGTSPSKGLNMISK